MSLKRSFFGVVLVTVLVRGLTVDELAVNEDEIEDIAQFKTTTTDEEEMPEVSCKSLLRLKVVPGYGWDNLRNDQRFPVFSTTYEKCVGMDAQDDVVLPDNVTVIHYHPSREEYRCQLFTDWTLYSEIGTNTINEDGDLEFGFPGVSGSFSEDYQKIKQKRIVDKEVIARYQLRYTSHTVRLVPGTKLDDNLVNRVRNMFSLVGQNQTRELRYHAELFVGKYGTHYINNVDVGLAVIQEDYLSAALLFDKNPNIAQQSFPVFVDGTTAFFNALNSLPLPNSYVEIRKSGNLTVSGTLNTIKDVNWMITRRPDGMRREPEILRIGGKSVDRIITAEYFPNEDPENIALIRHAVRTAIIIYYKTNSYPGCTSMESPNFNQWANQDDNSCKEPVHQYLFGGIYQTCTALNGSQNEVCSEHQINNVATGKQTCPDGYETKLLYDGTLTEPYQEILCGQVCSGFWFFKKCHLQCNTDFLYHVASFEVYWCDGGPNNVTRSDTLLFGGAFADHSVNPVTGFPTCPETYRKMSFADDFTICISNDTASGREHSLDLSGFSSCTNSITFLCPPGFFERTIDIRENCVIAYCIKRKNVVLKDGNANFPLLIPPPFSYVIKHDNRNATDDLPPTVSTPEEDQLVATDLVVGLLIAVLLIVLIIVIIVVSCLRKTETTTITPYTDIDKQAP